MPEPTLTVLVFLGVVALGSWVQGTTGFALGVVAMAILQVTDLMPLSIAAAIVSALAFFSVVFSLYGRHRVVDKRLFLGLIVGQVPAIMLGLWLLTVLERNASDVLALIFGLFLVGGNAALVLSPTPLKRRSSATLTCMAGFAGGIFGGLFSASGPITGWFAYRQPIRVDAIRASLLAMLLVTTVSRTTAVAIQGVFDAWLVSLVAMGLPVVALMTWLARRFPLIRSDVQLRRFVFILLTFVGIWISVEALLKLLD